jgi:CDP-diacylglycerol--serine O-phosphatidyltransferase
VLFAIFVVYGLSGYARLRLAQVQGHRASVISTSTDEPEESGLHR